MKVPRKSVERMALVRGPEFAAAVWQVAHCDHLACEVDDATWLSLLDKYPKVKNGFALGDAVAAVATPIARALKLGCIDPATNQLRPDSGCAKRREFLNQLSIRSE